MSKGSILLIAFILLLTGFLIYWFVIRKPRTTTTTGTTQANNLNPRTLQVIGSTVGMDTSVITKNFVTGYNEVTSNTNNFIVTNLDGDKQKFNNSGDPITWF